MTLLSSACVGAAPIERQILIKTVSQIMRSVLFGDAQIVVGRSHDEQGDVGGSRRIAVSAGGDWLGPGAGNAAKHARGALGERAPAIGPFQHPLLRGTADLSDGPDHSGLSAASPVPQRAPSDYPVAPFRLTGRFN
jgi:hypothetical protein